MDRLFNNIAVKKRLGLNKEELDSGNAIPKNKLLIINYLIDTVEKEAREKKLMKTPRKTLVFMHCAQYKSKIRKIVSKIWKFSIESN